MDTPSTVKIEISFVPTPSYPDDWTDVTQYVFIDTVQITRGGTDLLESIPTGTASFVLNNETRYFDPGYTGSPFYPYMKPVKRVRISSVWPDGDVIAYVGLIQSCPPKRDLSGKMYVPVTCVDALGSAFAQVTIPESLTIVEGAAFQVAQYDAVTGTASADFPGPPMTRMYLSNDFGTPATGGTFRVSVFGEFTTPLPYTVTGDQLIAALESLSVVEDNSVYATVYAPSGGSYPTQVRSGGFEVSFGGQYTGRNIVANISIDNTALLPSGAFFFQQKFSPATTAIPGVLQRAAGRDIEITLTTPIGVYGAGITVGIGGLLSNSRDALYEEITFTQAGPRVQLSPRSWDQIFRVTLGPWNDSRNAENTVAVRVLNDAVSSDVSGTMFQTAAQYAGWDPFALRLSAGVSTLLSILIVGKTITTIIQAITKSEGGATFISRDGYLTFKDRASLSDTSIISFGVGGAPFQDLTPGFDERYIRNSVTVTREGGTPQNVQDAESIEQYYIRSMDESGLLLTTDAEALSRATYRCITLAQPQTRIERLRFQITATTDPTGRSTILEADLTDTIVVVYEAAPYADPDTYTLSIQQIQIGYTAATQEVEWVLAPAQTNIFTLDSSFLDGDDVLLY